MCPKTHRNAYKKKNSNANLSKAKSEAKLNHKRKVFDSNSDKNIHERNVCDNKYDNLETDGVDERCYVWKEIGKDEDDLGAFQCVRWAHELCSGWVTCRI